MEIWRCVVGYPGYEVSNLGKIRGNKGFGKWPKRIITPINNTDGYPTVKLSYNKTRKKQPVHKLVLNAFARKRKRNECASHLNGNKEDNRAINLVWETLKDNMNRKRLHNTMPNGERNGSAILSEIDVKNIRNLCLSGHTFTSVGVKYGVTRTNIANIVKRKTWFHLA